MLSMFYDKYSFHENFPAICRQYLQSNGGARGGRGGGYFHILTLLGFAFHVHVTCQDAEWYEFNTVIETLEDILKCTDFDPDP